MENFQNKSHEIRFFFMNCFNQVFWKFSAPLCNYLLLLHIFSKFRAIVFSGCKKNLLLFPLNLRIPSIKKFLSNCWPKLQMYQISMRKNVLVSLFKSDIPYVWPFYQIVVVLLNISEKNHMSWLYLQI